MMLFATRFKTSQAAQLKLQATFSFKIVINAFQP